MSTISKLTGTMEDIWSQLQETHPDLPDVVIVIAPAGRSGKLGHFYRQGWTLADGGTRHEIAVSAEYLNRPAADLLTTLLHEGGHALATVRGIKDTSTHGMYHNKRFAALAEELGLQRPAKAHPLLGWSDCQLTEMAAIVHADHVMAIEAAQGLCRRDPSVMALTGGIKVGGAEGEDGEGTEPDPLAGKALCACGPEHALRLSKKALRRGVKCAVCDELFQG